MRIRRVAVVIGLGVLCAATMLFARDIETKSVTVDSEGAKRLDITFDFGAGDLRLSPADQDAAAKCTFTFDKGHYDQDVDYHVADGTGELTIESIHNSHDHIDTDNNKWDITLSEKYPTSLKLDVGACEAEMELGGIPLERLDINVGAASATIDFTRVNPGRLKEFKIETGASSLEMHDVGNANFELFEFEGGVGSYDLDFRGTYSGESEITLDIGLGSADIILPKDIACRVETDGGHLLSSIDFHGGDLDEIDDGVYESPGFEDATTRITVRVKVGLGSVDLYFK